MKDLVVIGCHWLLLLLLLIIPRPSSHDGFVVDFLLVIRIKIYFIIVVFVRESRAAAVGMIVIDVVRYISVCILVTLIITD